MFLRYAYSGEGKNTINVGCYNGDDGNVDGGLVVDGETDKYVE